MKKIDLKNLIKEAVREVLDEVVNVDTPPVRQIREASDMSPNMSVLRETMMENLRSGRSGPMTTNQLGPLDTGLQITNRDTATEGSALPAGSVSDNAIEKLLKGGL